MFLAIAVIMSMAVGQCWIAVFLPRKQPSDIKRSIAALNTNTLVAGTLFFVVLMPWIRSGATIYDDRFPPLLVALYGLEAVACVVMKTVRAKETARLVEDWKNSLLESALQRGLV